jgi:hypothetical protein
MEGRARGEQEESDRGNVKRRAETRHLLLTSSFNRFPCSAAIHSGPATCRYVCLRVPTCRTHHRWCAPLHWNQADETRPVTNDTRSATRAGTCQRIPNTLKGSHTDLSKAPHRRSPARILRADHAQKLQSAKDFAWKVRGSPLGKPHENPGRRLSSQRRTRRTRAGGS